MSVAVAACLVLIAVLTWPRRQRVEVDEIRRGWAARGVRERSSPAQGGGWIASRRLSPARLVGRGRRRDDEQEGTLGVLDSLAPALRAGLAPAAALRCLDVSSTRSPGVAPLLDRLLDAAEEGEPLARVWTRQARATGSVDLMLIGRAWALSESLGAPLADCVALAADLVRQGMARERRLAIALAGPRATTTVLTLLPVAGPAVALLLGITPGDLYAGAPALGSVLAGVLLLCAGRWWCARMVSGLSRPRPVGEGSS